MKMEEENNEKLKPSISEFHSILQDEIIMYDWCLSYYPQEYSGKYTDMVNQRIEKVKDISKRLGSIDVVSSHIVYESVYNKIFPNVGRPNFTYRNDAARLKMDHHSIRYYYYSGRALFVTETNEEVNVLGVMPEDCKVIVEFTDGREMTFEYNELKRFI